MKRHYTASTRGFSDIPTDTSVEISEEIFQVLLIGNANGQQILPDANGFPYLADPAPVVLTQAQVIASYEAALDAHMDSVAKLHRYDDRKSFALRAGYPGPYHAEGVAFGTWMDTCNYQAYQLLGDVLAGRVGLPSIADMIGSLPIFNLPE